jgi:putative SOS response-associated peptidase YedK
MSRQPLIPSPGDRGLFVRFVLRFQHSVRVSSLCSATSGLDNRRDGAAFSCSFRDGFIPSWSKEGKIAPINAMSAIAAHKPMFRTVMRNRCYLLPADGFYEWLKKGKALQPLHFHLRSGEPFGFAGIWETWHNSKDNDLTVEATALLTAAPNELVEPVHNRMPVILQSRYNDE